MAERQARKYPAFPGHAAGSATSAEAAESIVGSASTLRAKIWRRAFVLGDKGITSDEIERFFDMRHQTASARICELHLSGDLLRTSNKRKTRSGRNAFVYIANRRSAYRG